MAVSGNLPANHARRLRPHACHVRWGIRWVCGLALLWATLGIGTPTPAAPTGSATTPAPVRTATGSEETAPPEPTQTIELAWTHLAQSFQRAFLEFDLRDTAFPCEPTGLSALVVRGFLRLAGPDSAPLAFVWDRQARRLYFDLNRNLDLTDDPAGTIAEVAPQAGHSVYYQQFSTIDLPLAGTPGSRTVRVELTLSYAPPRLHGYAAAHSLWLGQVDLQGTSWQLGLVEEVLSPRAYARSTHLLFRPWSERERAFSTDYERGDTVAFGPRLFLARTALHFDLPPLTTNGATPAIAQPRRPLRITERHPVLGEVRFASPRGSQVVLSSGQYLVALTRPGPSERIPVGTYFTPMLWVQADENSTFPRRNAAPQARQNLVVAADRAVEMPSSLPLRNTVTARRRGTNLHLTYALRGADGADFSLNTQRHRSPPEFTVYQDGRKLGTGKFEFG